MWFTEVTENIGVVTVRLTGLNLNKNRREGSCQNIFLETNIESHPALLSKLVPTAVLVDVMIPILSNLGIRY
jgi:hypothetical protein